MKPKLSTRIRRAAAGRHFLDFLGLVGGSFGALAAMGYPKWMAAVAAVLGVYVGKMQRAERKPKP